MAFQTTAPSRILAIVNFNEPNARGSLKLPQIASALSASFKSVGKEQCALLARMPAYAKEDSEQDPLEDEINIKHMFARLASAHNSGFACS